MAFRPGQFNMLTAFGVGEAAISISSAPSSSGPLEHTVRDVGTVTHSLCAARVGDLVGVRGPFGTDWGLAEVDDQVDTLHTLGGTTHAHLRGDVVVVAGGMESMTKAPYLLPGARAGYRLGDGELVDSMMYDGLYCQFDHCAMGLGTERYNAAAGISRQAQDSFSALSHERAAAAIKEGRFADEIVNVSVPQRKGDPIVVDTDEGVRPGTTAESLGALKPAFDKEGTITAGNASQISDGGAAVIVTSRATADSLGVTPLGEVLGYGQVAGPDASLLVQPANAIKKALAQAGKSIGDVDLFEINEAFAAVGLASMADLGIGEEVTNVNGGAIALGHPIGMSGTRLALTVLQELRRRGGGTAAASLCGGGGQGDALLVRTLS